MFLAVQIGTAAAVFEHLAECPPLQRAQPPVAGSIRWSRCLFGRCKRTMARVAALNESVLTSDLGKAVRPPIARAAAQRIPVATDAMSADPQFSDHRQHQQCMLYILVMFMPNPSVGVGVQLAAAETSRYPALVRRETCTPESGYQSLNPKACQA